MLTWIMFLKFLDDMEQIRETEAKLENKKFKPTIDSPYRWRDWATKEDGITGDALIAFINHEKATLPNGSEGQGLFAYLKNLQSTNGRDRKDVVRTVFQGTVNRMINGYLLRDVINKINEINFTSSDEIHTLSHLYESMLKEMRDAAGDSGEFYTPRAVVNFIVKVVNPKLGETVLDPASGTGGFLVEAYEHLRKQCKKTEDHQKLQNDLLFGCEAKPLPYLLGQMNLLLHGLEYPQIDPGNALRYPLREIGDKDRVDVIVTNPPFGGAEEKGILTNFPEDLKTSETALLFLQLIMRKLKRPNVGGKSKGGRCGVVVPDGILANLGVASRIKDKLFKECNLHTVMRLPFGVFEPYTPIRTNILFFDKSAPTKGVWFYEIMIGEGRKKYTKTKPIKYEEFAECLNWWNNREENDNAWYVKTEDLVKREYNLDLKNPRKEEIQIPDDPNELMQQIKDNEKNIENLLGVIEGILNEEIK